MSKIIGPGFFCDTVSENERFELDINCELTPESFRPMNEQGEETSLWFNNE